VTVVPRVVCIVCTGRMFELFSQTLARRRPVLTKLDDDGETQMDMCKCITSPGSLIHCCQLLSFQPALAERS
jgi:hypothetical protein